MNRPRSASYAGYIYEKPPAGWSSPEEVRSRLEKVDLTGSKPLPAGGPPILWDGRSAYIDTSDTHTAVCAISGMKKTICYFMPLIYMLGRAGENMIINDPKGELFNRTAGFLAQERYQVLCLDFRSMNRDGCNILEYPACVYRSGNRDDGMTLLSDIVSTLSAPQISNGRIDTYWPITAASYQMGTGGIMFESFPNLRQIHLANWDRFNTEAGFEALAKLVKNIRTDDSVMLNLSAILSEPDRTLRSTVSTAHTFIAPFVMNNKLVRMLSHSTFQYADFCSSRTALYIITDDSTTTYNSIIGVILSQIRSYLVSAADKTGGKLTTRVNFVLDETCSLPFPHLEQALAADRGRNIRYHLCIQSLAGLKLRYPEYEALLANCGNLLFLGSTEAAMLDRISLQLGKTNITPDGRERPLVSAAELMTLKKSWNQKEGIYMNLPQSIRYCTSLPSIEAYPLGRRKAPARQLRHPPAPVYSPADLYEDVCRGRLPIPFSEQAEPSAKKSARSRKSIPTAAMRLEIGKKLEEMLNVEDFNDEEED